MAKGWGKNSKFFHNAASARKKKNTIIGTHTCDGRWVEGPDMVSAFVDYFDSLFSTSNPHDLNSVLHLMDCRLTDEIRAELDRDFSFQKVKQAVEQIPIMKSQRLYGLLATLYKKTLGHYWS